MMADPGEAKSNIKVFHTQIYNQFKKINSEKARGVKSSLGAYCSWI